MTFYFDWEIEFIVFLQEHINGFLLDLVNIITEFGDELFLVGVIGLIYWCLNKELGRKLTLRLGLINVINPFIKNVAKRNRPYISSDRIKCLNPSEDGDIYNLDIQGYSFPSGHASNTIAVYGGIAKYKKNKLVTCLMLIVILLIGLSRNIVGVHFPTDVIAGWIIGIITLALLDLCINKFGERKVYICLCILGLFGFLIATSNDYYNGYGIMVGTILSIPFEKKYVQFEGTNNIIECVIRVVIGVLCFIELNALMKLPFSTTFLESGTLLALLVRSIRYTCLLFFELGIYPMSFKYLHKLFGGKDVKKD